jgi:hypothetical protein
MENSFASLINELKVGVFALSDPTRKNGSLKALEDTLSKLVNLSEETKSDKIDFSTAFLDTAINSRILATMSEQSNLTLESLKTATKVLQSYLKSTEEPLNTIFDKLENVHENNFPANNNSVTPAILKVKIKKIRSDRESLNGILERALQEFKSEKGEKGERQLEGLVKVSGTIVDELKKDSSFISLPNVSSVVNEFVEHLRKSKNLFKDFNRQGQDLTGDEPKEIGQLIQNWGEAITRIGLLQQKDSISAELGNVIVSRSAIAQSVQMHELLELNYDYLTALVRSGDLVDPGNI